MDKIIEVKGLKKTYGNVQAVKGIDFYAEKGQLFAFLGPNGAGKSTTINMITTFLKPDDGEVIINGYRLGKEDDHIRQSIGTVFQESLLDRKLTVEENLKCRGSLYDLRGQQLQDAVENTIKMCELEEIRKRRYETLSGGQRRRCDIARALLHSPKILFLDEPTTGLDPKTRAMIWELIQKLQKEKGMSVFLTTHYMEEAASANYIIVIDQGKICAKGTPEQLKDMYAKDTLRLQSDDVQALREIIGQMGLESRFTHDALEIPLLKTMDALPLLNQLKTAITGFEVVHGTMDDAFLHIIHEEVLTCSH